jgi:biotin carboxyl carrier protein
MHDSLKRGIVLCLLAAAGGLQAIGCGGRRAARATTSPQAPSLAGWERPSRMSDAAPAERLDRPGARSSGGKPTDCGVGCEDAGSAAPGAAAAGPSGVRISLQPGMTLYSLARAYQVPLQTIMTANGILDPTMIRAGTEIYIPSPGGAAPPAPAPSRAPRTGGKTAQAPEQRPDAAGDRSPALMSIAWPLDGLITGGFGLRGRHHHHDGIDIDGTRGEEVRAVAAGVVVRAGSEGKYGKTVVIDHGDGVSTLYAHASRLLVRAGDAVEKGEAIAEVGATGNAHGTHLHFEVRKDGRPVDPLPYLEPGMMGSASR